MGFDFMQDYRHRPRSTRRAKRSRDCKTKTARGFSRRHNLYRDRRRRGGQPGFFRRQRRSDCDQHRNKRSVRTIDRGNAIPFGLFRYAVDQEQTVLGGAVSNAGNLRRWCLRELRLQTETLSRTAAAADEIVVLPFWVNERAPTWPENLRGTIVGLTQATSAPQILRATSCSVFYRLAGILELIETTAGKASEIIVSGGILHSYASLCLLADALGRDLHVSPEAEASLRGAAVYVLEKMGRQVSPLRVGKLIRHNRTLARKHRFRRERQELLEKLLS